MLLFIRRYRAAIKELVNEKHYIDAVFAMVVYPILYWADFLLGEIDLDDKES